MEYDEDNQMGEHEEGGTRQPQRVQNPLLPSQADRDEHELTHLPFRSWCAHCVRGCGQTHPHHRVARDLDAVPELHVDYCFMGKKEEKAQPILVARDRDTKMTLSFLVKEKGAVDMYVVKRIMAFLKELGYEGIKIIIKSDQESPIKAVIDKVMQLREGATVPEHSPVRSSGSNGIIERAIKEVESRVRCMKSALDERIGGDLSAKSNVLPWMVEFASVLINRYLVGRDGKTAYERAKGKSSKMLGFEFAERVHFRRAPTPGRLGKLDTLWHHGVFVGYRSISGEYMVVTEEGAYKTRTMRRMPFEERWSKEAVENLKYTPWRVKDPSDDREGGYKDRDHVPDLQIDVDKSVLPEAAFGPAPPSEPIPRRVYITKATLERHGITDGCLGCAQHVLGGPSMPHSEDCRKRIEQSMRADPEDRHRVKESSIKRRAFVEKHLSFRIHSDKRKRPLEDDGEDALKG